MNVFPVVHVIDSLQAVEQTAVAMDAGSDGVFLIDHSHRGEDDLVKAFNAVTSSFPEAYVGLNFLSRSTAGAFELVDDLIGSGKLHRAPNALWCDDAIEYAEDYTEAENYLRSLQAFRNNSPRLSGIKLLGGVAFKYTAGYTDVPKIAAHDAKAYAPFIDVITTSGEGTGHAPSPEKISAMKKVLGDQELAVASGIDASNLQEYGDSIDTVLIASSIETEPYSGIFDPSKIREFVALARKINQ